MPRTAIASGSPCFATFVQGGIAASHSETSSARLHDPRSACAQATPAKQTIKATVTEYRINYLRYRAVRHYWIDVAKLLALGLVELRHSTRGDLTKGQALAHR
jgi:hypothetical protein